MGIFRRGRTALAAFLLAAATACAFVAAAPVAQAAPRAPESASAADLTPIAGLVTVCDASNCFGNPHSTYDCAPGHAYNSSGDTVAGKAVLNGCSYRVWLDQNADGSGYSLCIKANSSTGALHRDYKRLYMSGSKPAC
jgi:hypothetical protein